jgi:serine protease Do
MMKIRILLFIGLMLGLWVARSVSAEVESISPDLFSNLVERVVPSVANLSSMSTVEKPLSIPYPFDELFYGKQRPMIRLKSLGSALLIDSSGLLMTNHHVIEGMTEVKIAFTDASEVKPLKGTVVGRDPDLDIALIKVDLPKKMPIATLGDSDRMKVGEFVLALGNPFGQGHSASHGILSAKERMIPGSPVGGFLQTDAAINPGNSGGPLLNTKGEVIGINTAIQFNAQGMSYAIPINAIKAILPELQSKGSVERGYVGMLVESIKPEVAKLLNFTRETASPIVTSVLSGSPAEKSGVMPYDLVLSINGKNIPDPDTMSELLQKSKTGDVWELIVVRNNKEKKIKITIARKESDERFALQKQERENTVIHPRSGVRVENLPENNGVLVSGVIPGSPADLAGIEVGDVLLELDRQILKNVEVYRALVSGSKKFLVRLLRTRMGRDSCTILELDLG